MSRGTAIVVGTYVAWLLILFVLMSSDNRSMRNAGDVWMVLLIWGPLLAIATLTAAVWVERRLKRR